MQFIQWLVEAELKDFNFWRNLILGKLGFEKEYDLSQSLMAMKPDMLINSLNELGEFKKLDQTTKTQVLSQVESKTGTLRDLIKIIASSTAKL